MATRRHGGRLHVRPGTFRAQMVRVLVLALASVLVPLGFLVAGEGRDYDLALNTSRTVAAVQHVQALIHEVQKERGMSVGLLGGDDRFRGQLATQRRSTDAALTSLRAQLGNGLVGAGSVQAALTNLDTLAAVRAAVDHGSIDRAGALAYFTGAIAALNNLGIGDDATSDPVLRRGLAALADLGDAKEYTGRERAVLSGVFAARRITRPDYVLLLDDLAGKQAAMARFSRDATTAQLADLAAAQRSPEAQSAAADEAVAVASDGTALGSQVDPLSWFSAMTTYIDHLRQVQIDVGDQIDARAAALRTAAQDRLVWIALLAVFVFGFDIWLGIRTLRSVVGPLDRLATDAHDLAARRLPLAVNTLLDGRASDVSTAAPVSVPLHSGSEIAAVAAALDQVRTAALTLATGQAALRRDTNESLVNLARRHQNLVRRQLALISRLEQDELDADLLADLFSLDHLATRMRRNAESLLVLVGQEPTRRWSEPVPVADLVRAAMSEVEDYPRVALGRIDEARFAGATAAELAHLLAELIENSLNFSPPHAAVRVGGWRDGDGYVIEVADRGLGMTASALAAANAKLDGSKSFDVAPTRLLGHHVVGRLAQRLGARVSLESAPNAGTTAAVRLPAALLADAGGLTRPERVGAALAAFSTGHRRGAAATTAPTPAAAPIPSALEQR